MYNSQLPRGDYPYWSVAGLATANHYFQSEPQQVNFLFTFVHFIKLL